METKRPEAVKRSLRFLLRFALACIFASLASCAVTPPAGRAPHQPTRFEIPAQPNDTVRLVIYRPQRIVGAWGKPMILVNGQNMLDLFKKESALEPGTVLIVDAPREGTRIEWATSRTASVHAEPLLIRSIDGSRQFFRWSLKPTYGYLEKVEEAIAVREAGGLLPAGYKNMAVPTKK